MAQGPVRTIRVGRSKSSNPGWKSNPGKKSPKAGPFVQTARAKKTPGKTVAVGGTQVIGPEKKGQKPVAFKKGGLHETLGVPQGEKIPASKMAAAKRGEYGPKGKKQANMATGLLAAGRATARKNKAKK